MMQKSKNILEFDGLGTRWWIEVFDEFDKNTVSELIYDEIINFSKKFSRFDNESLVSQLNSAGFLIKPDNEMLEMMEYAKNAYKNTNGIFNIFIGGILENSGYGKGGADIPTDNIWENIQISKTKISIPADTHIDFGGFGKGWLIDKLATKLKASGINNFVINGGGDIYVGNMPTEIMLESPNDNSVIGSITLKNQALAASSIKKRSWQFNGSTVHHIIDPRTKKSSQNKVLGSFVISKNARTADTIATCLVIEPSLKSQLESIYNSKSLIVYGFKNQKFQNEFGQI